MIVALTGGIGGAKLALGLSRVLPPAELTVVVNTGDDFEHLGLAISPDLDTVMYTLAGVDNTETGWGRRDESWHFMAALEGLGGETWFRLGDRDLATHVERTRRLKASEPLSLITSGLCRQLGIGCRVLPMTDDAVRTRLAVRADGEAETWMDFQDYFVRRRCEPRVASIRFEGAERARPLRGLITALADPGLRAVVICPSNPWLSVDPILALPGLREALDACSAPVIAVSPIIGGRAVKGPTAKIMMELGLDASAAAVARHYGKLLDVFVVDDSDASGTTPGTDPAAPDSGVQIVARRTLMKSHADRDELARAVIALAGQAVRRPRGQPSLP